MAVTRVSKQRRLIGDFQFTDNQLQRVLGEIRDAVKHLQGLVGETNQVITLENIQDLINNINLGGGGISEAPIDGILYGRKDANWESVLDEVEALDTNIDGGAAASVYLTEQVVDGGSVNGG